ETRMTTLDDLLAGPGIIIAPGAYDALSARLAVQAGASVVYMTGFGVSGAGFGLPDIGLVSAAEMAERVRVIAASAAPVPLIADGDNGHGGPLNAARLTRAYEQAGAACIQIEDPVFPKRCGRIEGKEATASEEAAATIRAAAEARTSSAFITMARPKRCGQMEGKEVIAIEEAAAKIRAAAEARTSAAFKIMARTDARATHDLDEALRRGEAFLRAGADILFIEAPRDEAEMRKVAET